MFIKSVKNKPKGWTIVDSELGENFISNEPPGFYVRFIEFYRQTNQDVAHNLFLALVEAHLTTGAMDNVVQYWIKDFPEYKDQLLKLYDTWMLLK